MPIGNNVNLADKLIKKTTGKTNITSKESIKSNVGITNNTNIVSKKSTGNRIGQPSMDPKATTYKTKKTTFYIKDDLLKKLYNFAYWERYNITEAFNSVLTDGLRNKNTKPKE